MISKSISIFFACSILFVSCNTTVKKEKIKEHKEVSATELVEAEPVKLKDANYDGMVLFPAGNYQIGNETGLPNESPVHEQSLKAFYIDKSPVTVAQFSKFVSATGFKTEAEKFGDSGVFNFISKQWELKKGVYWEYPLGKEGNKAMDDHPVTHVSWNDALAYANWVGKRLPFEYEWEVAARSGESAGSRFSWGDAVKVDGKYGGNVWQGSDIGNNLNEDGFEYTSPVGAFGTNKAGLTDMGGNVWNWCQDTFEMYTGNKTPHRKDDNVKVIRGGSFFFDQNGENSYTVSGRSSNSHETSLFNTGFRCAADAK